ncbi:tetratricopeptide repeat protein [Micromonospora sp. WMMD723]|uniref:tetratricopeptide repeat protein n=1 Tax=Micromonospora sp. WMMD723 TaxID=3403465 RepID=UPI003CE9A60C
MIESLRAAGGTSALTTSHEAVNLHQELTTTNRDTHLPDLAASLINHAVILAEAGQHTEALTTSHEAVNLYRQLASTNRDAYLPNLALALRNVGFIALLFGRVDELVIALTAEGVQYFDELATAEPAVFEERRQVARQTLDDLSRIAGADHDGSSSRDPEPS